MYQSNLQERKCLEHPEMRVILVCFNEKCQTNRLLCAKCNPKHSAHSDRAFDINTLEESIHPLVLASKKILDSYNIPIDNIIRNINQLKKIITIKQNKFIDHLKEELDYFDIICSFHNNDILMICKEKMCQGNKYMCCDCTKNHQNHDLLDKKKFKLIQEKMRKKLILKSALVQNIIDNLSQQLVEFKVKLNEKYSLIIENFMLMNNKNISLKITLLQNWIDQSQKDLQATIQFFHQIFKQMDQSQNSTETYNKSNAQQLEEIRVPQNLLEGFEKTIDILRNCQEGNQGRQYLSHHKGDVLRKLNLYDQSLFWYDQTIQKNSLCKEALFGKGIVLKYQKNYQEALEYFTKFLLIEKNKSEHIEALCEKGDCLYVLKNFKEALSVYEQVLALQQNKNEALIGKGNALRMLDKYQDSIKWQEKALSFNPNNPYALRGKGMALRMLGNNQESIEWFDKALAINPKDEYSINGKGTALRMLGKYQESIEWFDKALAVNPNNKYALYEEYEALHFLALDYELLESFDEALDNKESMKLLDRAFLNLPNQEKFSCEISEILQVLDQDQESIESFVKASAQNLYGKNAALQLLGLDSESIELLARTFSINLNYKNFLLGKGKVLNEISEYQESIDQFDALVANNRRFKNYLQEKGEVLRMQGKFQETIERQGKHLTVGPNIELAQSEDAYALDSFDEHKLS